MSTSNPSEYEGHTLYELLLIDAIKLSMTAASDRLRLSTNLHYLATRALFSATESVPNRELMRAIRGVARAVSRGDTREARHYRFSSSADRKGKPERTLKLDRIRQIVLNLLAARHISNADAARSWQYAVIHESARVTVATLRKQLGQLMTFDELSQDPLLAGETINQCDAMVQTVAKKYFDDSTLALEEGRPLAEERRFLDFCTTVIFDAMHRPVSPWVATKDLLNNVYPEIDRYEFGTEERSAAH